ncbi:NAD(+)/NADH kinase [Candidatus Desantisbacteria bacterium]|nr:NAD(+)/NADH kinase [Candidatus Desantisbacteria bacterium]
MKYGIIANPCSGTLSIDKKNNILKQAAKFLGDECIIAGLDTKSAKEFCDCVKDIENNVDIIIGCGGDGTICDIINTIRPETTIAYLPFGTGNALKYTLHLSGSVIKNLNQIKNGKTRYADLILCDAEKKALFASVGLDGHILKLREQYIREDKSNRLKGLLPYIKATAKSITKDYVRSNVEINIDGEIINVPDFLSIIVTKIPYYGFGLNIVPDAKISDGNIHILYLNSGILKICYGIAASFLYKNKIGEYKRAEKISIKTNIDLYLQIHGTLEKKNNYFQFEILPDKLKMRY